MPKITIDHREVEVPPGATILQAARKLGIDVPTLCFLEGYKPSTSCLACIVKVGGRLVPSCATEAVEAMEVESETAEVHHVRRTALELLLSDHLGDCLAPCYFACPARMDIPRMLRQINGDDLQAAIVTIKEDIALPAVLGRICPQPCEKGCRRGRADGAVAIRELKRYVADADLATAQPYLPKCEPSSGQCVAVVGAGPTGLSAAYYLARQGHAVMLLDDQPAPGGRLRHEYNEEELPRDVLDAEIATIIALGIELRLNSALGSDVSLDELCEQCDAVLVACGAVERDQVERLGLKAARRGIQIEKQTYATSRPGVFAAGNAIRAKGLVVRSAADGKEAATAISQYLAGAKVTGTEKPFSSRMGKLSEEEVEEFLAAASQAPRADPRSAVAGFSPDAAIEQAGRCLHCDCRALETCQLKRYAELYGADANRFKDQRAVFQQNRQHSDVLYEPGKCINCGLCIEIASLAGEPLGLTFVGRGFDVRVGVPFQRSMEEALSKVAAECAQACPTAALALKRDECRCGLC